LFSKCGEIRRIIMGLDKFKKTPCGFCFVEYYTHDDAADCVKYVNGTRLDDRVIRTDWDVGFRDGRQYGRGKTGGQVRDEYRSDYDPGRGGYGKQKGTDDGKAAAPAVATETPAAVNPPTHYNSQFQSSEYNWRTQTESEASPDAASKKRQREDTVEEPNKKAKESEVKNPRFREGKESDEDEE